MNLCHVRDDGFCPMCELRPSEFGPTVCFQAREASGKPIRLDPHKRCANPGCTKNVKKSKPSHPLKYCSLRCSYVHRKAQHAAQSRAH